MKNITQAIAIVIITTFAFLIGMTLPNILTPLFVELASIFFTSYAIFHLPMPIKIKIIGFGVAVLILPFSVLAALMFLYIFGFASIFTLAAKQYLYD